MSNTIRYKAVLGTISLILLLLLDSGAYCEDNKISFANYVGNWLGKTSQGHSISFKVENVAGVATVVRVKYKLKLIGSSYSVTKTMMQPVTIKAKIINGKFKHSGMFDFSGIFVKKNVVEGILKEVNLHPQGYGKAVGYVSYSASKVGSSVPIETPKPPKLPEKRLKKIQLIKMQQLLIKLGFSPGPADGTIGPKTERAVREFQKNYGMKVDGKISEELLEQLRIKHLIIGQEKMERSFTNSIGMKFVYIPPGTFMMGSPHDEKGRSRLETQHHVTLTEGFYLMSTEVTQGQWKEVMGSSKTLLPWKKQINIKGQWKEVIGSNPSFFDECGDECPVDQVSWEDVQDFIQRLNHLEGGSRYRLPTEAEWEYACRAGSQTAFYFGNDESFLSKYAWFSRNSYDMTHPVARKRPNAWGLYDMLGNVCEWCWDNYGSYPREKVIDPKGPDSAYGRINRGGSWINGPRFMRSACRSGGLGAHEPTDRHRDVGFRLLRSK